MTSLITIRAAKDAGLPAYIVDAVPHAYEEAGRVQFGAVPGVTWVRDRNSPNGRGFYRGPIEAVRIVVATLEAAGVCKVVGLTQQPPDAPVSGKGAVLPRDLRDYQRDGASWLRWQLLHSGAALLADDMGIGKSAQAIAALDVTIPDGNVIVVGPALARKHWAGQTQRWSHNPGRWHTYSYEGFQKAKRLGTLPPAKAIVIDEIHYCSNPKALRTKAVAQWCEANPEALRVGLSGTPMTARPRDMWHVLEILWPGRFGKRWAFERRYCDGHQREITNDRGQPVMKPSGEPLSVWTADGVSHADELAIRLQACMLRRTKSEVALELPPRTRTVIEVEIPASAKRTLARANAAAAVPMTAWGTTVSSLLSNIEGYKIEAACELARDITATGGRVLVLTTRRETAQQIGDALQAPVVTGEVAADTREALLRDAPIGVATMYSVTTVIDLVGFDSVIFVGLDWIPSTLLQAEARIHRLGQLRNVNIYYLIGAGTLDEVVRERVLERLDTFAAITGKADDSGMGAALGGGSEEDLIAALVAAIGAKAPEKAA